MRYSVAPSEMEPADSAFKMPISTDATYMGLLVGCLANNMEACFCHDPVDAGCEALAELPGNLTR